MKAIATIAIGLTLCEAADAQVDSAKPFFKPALDQLGVYLTAPVAEDYRRRAATKFYEGAAQAGFSSFEAKSIADGMTRGDIRFEPGGKWGSVATTGARVELESGLKAGYLQSIANAQNASAFLERYSTIKLKVTPTPPRDYKVMVNGEECPATEAGIYKVLPGESSVSATRPTRPKCQWHGPIAPGAVQEVDCSL